MDIRELRRMALDQMPADARFQPADAAVIEKYQDFLRPLEDGLVQGFYDLLLGHRATNAIFAEGERPAREQTLRDWYGRVLRGPIDDSFWDWMTFVGLVHVVRKVKNPMMLTAWGFVLAAITKQALADLPSADAEELISALTRFGQTFTSLVAEGYLTGVAEATGTSLALLENLASVQFSTELGGLRQDLKAA